MRSPYHDPPAYGKRRCQFLIGVLACAGCASGGGTAPPFRGPIVSSVSIQQMPRMRVDASSDTDTDTDRHEHRPRRIARGTTIATQRMSSKPYRGRATSVRVIVVQAPSPAVNGNSAALAGKLRALVGKRDRASTHAAFVVQTLRRLGARVPPALRGAIKGDDLVKQARQRSALMGATTPRLGDIIVFDEFLRKKPSSMTAIVITIDQRGTVEFVYLARKVVRRGFMNLRQRKTQRDTNGRIMNTLLRHLQSGDSKRTPYLSGQLFASYISLRKLTR